MAGRPPFRLGDWEVHTEDGTLRAASETRRIEPQTMRLLVFLSDRWGSVVSKQDLIEGVWDGRVVSDDALTGSISQLRRALGDDARSPRYVETLAKRGYRLLSPVETAEVEATEVEASPAVSVHAVGAGTGQPPRGAHRRVIAAAALITLGAAALLSTVVLRLASRPAVASVSAARDACRKGRTLLDSPSPANLEQARLDFQRAAGLDPGLAEADAGLSKVFLLQAFVGTSAPAELYPRARSFALRAVEKDDSSAAAHAALGAVALFADRDFARAEDELRRSVALDPSSAEPRWMLSLVLGAAGKREAAVREALAAVERAPSELAVLSSAMEVLFLARRYDLVLQLGQKALALSPDYPTLHFQMGWAWARTGEDALAYRAFRLGCLDLGVPEENLARLDAVFTREGLPGVFRSIAQALDGSGPVPRVRWGDQVAFEVGAGVTDRALALLEAAAARGEPGVVWLQASPFLDGLRTDARFERLVRRLGLPAVPGD